MLERKVKCLEIANIRQYNNSLFKLTINKGTFDFIPGQHISLGVNGIGSKEYSIASGLKDDFFDVIIRKVSNGKVSVALCSLKRGDSIQVGSPIGFFTLPKKDIGNNKKKIYLIATGTGIAPFRCFSHSFPINSFTILHGISNESDILKTEFKSNVTYISCSTKTPKSDYNKRVTCFLEEMDLKNDNSLYFLCGNGSMIYDAYRILSQKKIGRENIFYEEYF